MTVSVDFDSQFNSLTSLACSQVPVSLDGRVMEALCSTLGAFLPDLPSIDDDNNAPDATGGSSAGGVALLGDLSSSERTELVDLYRFQVRRQAHARGVPCRAASCPSLSASNPDIQLKDQPLQFTAATMSPAAANSAIELPASNQSMRWCACSNPTPLCCVW